MTHVVVRAWLLWGVITLSLNWIFGFNQWIRLWELVEVSTPQVEAFIEGITNFGWLQLIIFVIGFLRRRAIFMALKRSATFLTYVLSSVGLRRWYKWLITLPTHYSMQVHGWFRKLHGLKEHLFFQRWFLAIYTALALTGLTFIGAEALLALIRGTLYLPPIIVRYQAELMTFIGSYVAASVAQVFLAFLWELVVWDIVYASLPKLVHRRIEKKRVKALRYLVIVRKWRIAVTATFFKWQTWLISIILSILGGSAF